MSRKGLFDVDPGDHPPVRREGLWKLPLDLWTAKVIVWVASVGRSPLESRFSVRFDLDNRLIIETANILVQPVIPARSLNTQRSGRWTKRADF